MEPSEEAVPVEDIPNDKYLPNQVIATEVNPQATASTTIAIEPVSHASAERVSHRISGKALPLALHPLD